MTSSASLVRRLPLLETELVKRRAYPLRALYPDAGPLRRELYAKFLDFFAAGATFRERFLMAGNRVGKTVGVGGYETTLHMTGRYDEYAPWWTGRRFDGPVNVWAAGDTSYTVRDIVQKSLYGPPNAPRTGLIPAHLIEHVASRAGVPDALSTIWVRHVERDHGASCVSVLQFKSYDQRRESFQGTSQHLVWLDEEPPLDIYVECLLRTMDTPQLPNGGLILATFTPLQGMTELIKTILPDGQVEKEKEAAA